MCQTPTETGLLVNCCEHWTVSVHGGLHAKADCGLKKSESVFTCPWCFHVCTVREAQVVPEEAIALRDVIGHVAEWAAMMDNLDSRDDEEQANLDANTKMLRNLRSLLAKLPTGAQLRARLEGE